MLKIDFMYLQSKAIQDLPYVQSDLGLPKILNTEDIPRLFKLHATHLVSGQSPTLKTAIFKRHPIMGGKLGLYKVPIIDQDMWDKRNKEAIVIMPICLA